MAPLSITDGAAAATFTARRWHAPADAHYSPSGARYATRKKYHHCSHERGEGRPPCSSLADWQRVRGNPPLDAPHTHRHGSRRLRAIGCTGNREKETVSQAHRAQQRALVYERVSNRWIHAVFRFCIPPPPGFRLHAFAYVCFFFFLFFARSLSRSFFRFSRGRQKPTEPTTTTITTTTTTRWWCATARRRRLGRRDYDDGGGRLARTSSAARFMTTDGEHVALVATTAPPHGISSKRGLAVTAGRATEDRGGRSGRTVRQRGIRYLRWNETD